MLLEEQVRSLRNLTFDQLCQLYTVAFGQQPTITTTQVFIEEDGSGIADNQKMLALEWATGELVLGVYHDMGDEDDGLEPLGVDKTIAVRDQLTAFNVALS